jgi:glycosyltransferase involved in cell wall biosynthesis
MNIVIDARNRPSSTGRYTDRLLEHLQKIDTDNSYTVLLQPSDTWRPTAKNFNTLPCPYQQFSISLKEQVGFTRLLRKLRPDVVHFTMTQQPLFYRGNIVTTTHDLTMLRFTRAGRHSKLFHALRMALYRLMFWWSHKKSTKIITVSKFVASDLTKLQPSVKNKITTIYESSEPPVSQKAEAVEGVGKQFIMHVGSPFPHKNIPRLIESFEQIVETHPKLQLVLAGKPEYYFGQLQKQIDESPAKQNIIVTGFVSDAQLKWLYQYAICYVLPSLSEGFGLPGLEAMAHKCPLVSSNATCLPEVYGDAALYFNPLDVEDMTLKIERILSDNQLASLLKLRGETQLKKYSWERMAEQTLAIYNETNHSSEL